MISDRTMLRATARRRGTPTLFPNKGVLVSEVTEKAPDICGDMAKHPHFTVEGAEARLREAIPGATVAVEVADGALWISAVFPASSYLDALRRVRVLLLNGVDVEPWPNIHLGWAPDRRAWELGLIRQAAVDALPRLGGNDLSSKVTVTTSGSTLRIHVCTSGLFDLLRTSSAQRSRIKSEWFQKVSAAVRRERLPEGLRHFVIQIGEPELDWSLPKPLVTRAYEDDDDDDSQINPNWPSRTGNVSGGGRGNNPPRR